MTTRWTVLLLSCAAFAGCSAEEAKTPDEIAAGSSPVDSSEAPPAAPKKMVENVAPSDMTPQTVKPTTLKPVTETERAEVTRPAETPPLPLARTEPQEPAPEPKPAATEPAADSKPGDQWGPFASMDGERRRDRRRRSSGRGPATAVVPPFFGGSGFGAGGFGNNFGGAGFGSDPVAPPDFGSYAPDTSSTGSEYTGTPLGGYDLPGGSDLPADYASGGYGGDYYPPGYGDEFDLTGDDLAGATDGYIPPRGGPTGGHDGPTGPTGPSDGGLQPTPPIPPPDF